MHRNELERLLLAEALVEVERTSYPEGVGNAAINLAKQRLALVPTPLLVSGGQNVAKLLTWAAAEVELEMAGIIEEEPEDRFDTVTEGPRRPTRFESELKIGDCFEYRDGIYAVISDIRQDEIRLDYLKGAGVVEATQSRQWVEAMMRAKKFRRPA